MPRFLKTAAMIVGALLLLVVVGVAGLYAWSGKEIGKRVETPPHAFTAPSDSASVARGQHVVRTLAKCVECHGQDLGGGIVVDDPAIGRIYAPNLTAGVAGIGAAYRDADWERAVRHGIARDGRRLLIMPSNEYQYLSDEDLGTVVAYIRSVPAVDREAPPAKVGPIARALYAAGKMPLFPAMAVTHGADPVPSVPADSTVAYGEYVGAVGCSGCHGATYGGGKIPGTPPEWPAPANLTPAGIGHYSFEDFARALRTGTRPDGSAIDPFMPIAATSRMTDLELRAVFEYLQSIPSRPFGSR
jgi:mono/diheme cytochrome c family protein